VEEEAFEAAIPDHPLLAIAAARDWCPAVPEPLPARPATTRDIPSPSSTPPPAPAETPDADRARARDTRLADKQRRQCAQSAARLERVRAMAERSPNASRDALLARVTAKHEAMCGK
jgi:hypothetical protein